MRILFIRHGQTPANVLGALDTAHPGPGLTELGLRQARAIPLALADERIEDVFVSTLRRTQVTAEPLAADRRLDARIMPGIHVGTKSRSEPTSTRSFRGQPVTSRG
jgi:broad specificity phosphatase PhoE